MINPLHSIHVWYRLVRRRLFRYHVASMVRANRRFDARLKRGLRVDRGPHVSTNKVSDDYMKSLR